MSAIARHPVLLVSLVLGACGARPISAPQEAPKEESPVRPAAEKPKDPPKDDKVVKSDEEWRRLLTPEQYRILREKGTERAFTGAYWSTTTPGTYLCAGCGTPLFLSDAKFESGCGWPSFFEPLEGAHLTQTEDLTLGMRRIEVTCSKCGGHLGHVFDDGPAPTGLRFCINSGSIRLEEKKDAGGTKPPNAKPPTEKPASR